MRHEDFRVEEIPLGRARGHGPWLRVQIEKRATTTFDVLLFASKAARTSERRIGYAGLKDSQAITSQYLTVPWVPRHRLEGAATDRWRVLAVEAHDATLKIGHLAGNRFTIRIRDVNPAGLAVARERLETMVARGMQNAYGGQRFGTRMDGHVLGRLLAENRVQEWADQFLGRPSHHELDPAVIEARKAYDAGDYSSAFATIPLRHREIKRALGHLARGGEVGELPDLVGKTHRRMWLSAWQSYVFNRVLDRRIRDGTHDRLLPGDVAWLDPDGCLVDVGPAGGTGPAGIDPLRFRPPEASPTGPLAGSDCRMAGLEPGALEAQLLAEEGCSPEVFRGTAAFSRGTRRPLVVPVREASIEQVAPRDVVVRFVLPPGAFATVLLEALMGASPGVCPGGCPGD